MRKDINLVFYIIFALLGLSSTKASIDTPDRVVSIGDVHGDLNALVAILKKTNLIEENTVTLDDKITPSPPGDANERPGYAGESSPPKPLRFFEKALKMISLNTEKEHCEWKDIQEKRIERYRWIGGETVLVQTGDLVDRGPDTIAVYLLMMKLQKQARDAGGRVIVLLGNHETANLCGNLNYVSDEDYETFGPSLSRRKQEANRKHAFSKTGFLGQWIRQLDSVAKVGRVIYSHAGVVEFWAKYSEYSIENMNQLVRDAIKDCDSKRLEDQEGPQWNRYYDLIELVKPEERDVWESESIEQMKYHDNLSKNKKVCNNLMKVLEKLKASVMVIGHNAQWDGKIHKFCDNKLFLIDVAMSTGMRSPHEGLNNNPPAALELLYTYKEEDSGRILTDPRANQIYASSRTEA